MTEVTGDVVEKTTDDTTTADTTDKATDKAQAGAGEGDTVDKAKDEFAWPDDWRDRVADGDEDLAKELARYGSLKNVAKALRDAKATIRSGKLQKPMPDTTDEKALADWRKEQGIPDDPSGYKLPETVVKRITDDDKPMLASFTEYAHKKGQPQAAIDFATEWYFDAQEAALEQQAITDREASEASEDQLRKDLAPGDYKATLTLGKSFISSIPGVGENWTEFRGPNGQRLGDNPDFILWAADMGRNQFGDTAFANSDSERKHTARKEEIETIMNTDINKYRQQGLDKEYDQIIQRELKRKK
jgi:hypothetical protein